MAALLPQEHHRKHAGGDAHIFDGRRANTGLCIEFKRNCWRDARSHLAAPRFILPQKRDAYEDTTLLGGTHGPQARPSDNFEPSVCTTAGSSSVTILMYVPPAARKTSATAVAYAGKIYTNVVYPYSYTKTQAGPAPYVTTPTTDWSDVAAISQSARDSGIPKRNHCNLTCLGNLSHAFHPNARSRLRFLGDSRQSF